MSSSYFEAGCGRNSAAPLPRGERGGGVVKGLSGAPLDNGWGQRPPSSSVQMGPKATDLISSAQVTPLSRRIAERQRRRLSKGRSHKLWDVRDVHRVALRGMGRPGFERTGLTSATWDFSAGCENPRVVSMDGAPCTLQGRRKAGRGFGLTMYVRCRKCPPCLGRRRNLWAYRAQEEIKAAPRTWMATFTWSPMQHFMMRARASARLAAAGWISNLSPHRNSS